MARPKRTPIEPHLLEHRQRLGLTQEQVAERLGITPEMVRRHERGLSTPIATYRVRYCKLYNSDEVTLGLSAAEAGAARSTSTPDFEDVLDVMGRVQLLERASIGRAALDTLALSLDDYVDRYEREGPKPLMGPLVRQRSIVEEMIANASHHSERRQLYEIAGRTSGLLAYMCVNRGRYPLARAYCKEAFMLGDLAGCAEVQAWVRGTQSFCEYYAGDFEAATNLAVDGLRYAGDGPQAVRLLINGQARALAKLGDFAGVDATVDRSSRLLERNPMVPGVSPCISFGGYSSARAASNAVTAYVDLGAIDRAKEHAELAATEFDLSDSAWSQALIRIDLAKAVTLRKDGDPEEAASLLRSALQLSSDKPIASVVVRSQDVVRQSSKIWRGTRAVADLRDAVSSTHLS